MHKKNFIKFLVIFLLGIINYSCASSVLETLKVTSGPPYLFGFIDITGNLQIDYKYEEARRFSRGLAPVKKKGLWGYINSNGIVVIPFRYKDAKSFSKETGLAPAQEDSNSEKSWGFIDTTGNWVIKPAYYNATEFVDGVAEVAKEKFPFRENSFRYDKYFLTKDEKLIYSNGAYPFLSGPGKFSEGLLPACKDGKWGFKDISDAWVISPKYSMVGNFRDGMARVFLATQHPYTDCNWVSEEEIPGKWGFIDRIGRLVVPMKYKYAEDFHRGVALVDEIQSKTSLQNSPYSRYYITTKGEKAFSLQFREASSFLDSGYALVGSDEKNVLKIDPTQRGFIDLKGQRKDFYLEDYARILNVRHGNEELFRVTLEMKPEGKEIFYISRYYNSNDLTQSILQDFPPCFSGSFLPPDCMTDNFSEGLSWVAKRNY